MRWKCLCDKNYSFDFVEGLVHTCGTTRRDSSPVLGGSGGCEALGGVATPRSGPSATPFQPSAEGTPPPASFGERCVQRRMYDKVEHVGKSVAWWPSAEVVPEAFQAGYGLVEAWLGAAVPADGRGDHGRDGGCLCGGPGVPAGGGA